MKCKYSFYCFMLLWIKYLLPWALTNTERLLYPDHTSYIIKIYVSNVSGMHWDIDITNFPRYDNYEYWRYKNASCNSYNNMFILYRYTPSFKPWILNNACHCLGLTMHFSLHCWLHSFSYAILQFGDNRYNRIDYQSFISLNDTLPLNCFFYT